MCFSTLGKVYCLKVYEIPEGGACAGGRPMVNLLPLEKEEQISAILPVNILLVIILSLWRHSKV